MVYTFINRDENSSIYNALKKLLLSGEFGEWKLLSKEDFRFDLMFGDRNGLPFAKLGQGDRFQLVNYYRGSSVICKKVALTKTLKSHCQLHKISMYDWIPLSYVVIPQSPDLNDYSGILRQRYEAGKLADEREQLRKAAADLEDSVWIAKPSFGAKGDGIKLSKDIEELIGVIDAQNGSHVIQMYISKPLLLNGNRKFDIRSWALLDHNYAIYLFKEGVLRTASDPYIPEDLSIATSHLTNHCLQEAHSSNYGKFEEGNEMFFPEFKSFLASNHGVNFDEIILPQMKNIIRTCLDIIKEKISVAGLTYKSFQLFGFDFMIDDEFKVWLIEINGAPACAQKLLPTILHSILLQAIFPLFPVDHKLTADSNLFEVI